MGASATDLAQHYPLSAEQSNQYRRDGHICLPGVLSPELVGHYGPLIIGLVDELTRTRDLMARLEDSKPLFIQATNLWRKNDEIRELVLAERFGRIAAGLMGVRAVRLYHDRALIKEPGGFGTPWHKDHYNWPLATHRTIKMWLALSDVELEMGAMRFASGTHHSGFFPELPISYSSEELFDRMIRDHRTPIVSYALKAGDATFHSGEVLHAALPNSTNRRREVIAIIYFEDGTRVMKPNHTHREADLAEFLPGLNPGDLAAGPLNPVVFRSEA